MRTVNRQNAAAISIGTDELGRMLECNVDAHLRELRNSDLYGGRNVDS